MLGDDKDFDFYTEYRKGYWRGLGAADAAPPKNAQEAEARALGTRMALGIVLGLLIWSFVSSWLRIWPNAPIPPLNDPADLPAVTPEHVPGF